jgi:putative transposase
VLIPQKESNAMKKHITSTAIPTHALKTKALASMSASFERFCLAAGIETLSEMMEQDATAACGERHERAEQRQAHRWGSTKGEIGFHGGKVLIPTEAATFNEMMSPLITR